MPLRLRRFATEQKLWTLEGQEFPNLNPLKLKDLYYGRLLFAILHCNLRVSWFLSWTESAMVLHFAS